MSELRIITNNHTRDILYWYELSDKQRLEFNWLDTQDKQDDVEFFIYKDNVYCLDEFMRIENYNQDNGFDKWDGYLSDSFFSGILIKYPYIDKEPSYGYDTEHIIVGWYYS